MCRSSPTRVEQRMRLDLDVDVQVAGRRRRERRRDPCRPRGRARHRRSPAGMRTLIVSDAASTPWPWQVSQASCRSRPVPPQCAAVLREHHVAAHRADDAGPSHARQRDSAVRWTPVPAHDRQVSCRVSVTGRCAPRHASSNDSIALRWRSAPRSAVRRALRLCRVKTSSNRSPKVVARCAVGRAREIKPGEAEARAALGAGASCPES